MSDEFPIGMRFRVPVETPVNLVEAEIMSEADMSAWFDDGDYNDEDDERPESRIGHAGLPDGRRRHHGSQ